EIAHDNWHRYRVLNDCCRDVARAISDRRSVAGAKEFSVYVGVVPSSAGRNPDNHRHICGNDAAVYVVRESGSDHFDMGTQGRHACSAGAYTGRGGRAARAVENAAMKAIYGLYSDPESAQHAVESLRRAGVGDQSITVMASQPFEEYE